MCRSGSIFACTSINGHALGENYRPGFLPSPRVIIRSRVKFSLYELYIEKKSWRTTAPDILWDDRPRVIDATKNVACLGKIGKPLKLTGCKSVYNLCILWEKQRVFVKQILRYLRSAHLAHFCMLLDTWIGLWGKMSTRLFALDEG